MNAIAVKMSVPARSRSVMAETRRTERRSVGSSGFSGGTSASNQERRGCRGIDYQLMIVCARGRPVNTAGPYCSSRDEDEEALLSSYAPCRLFTLVSLDDRVAALQVHGHRMVPADRTGRGTVPTELLDHLLLLFVGVLKLLETWRE